MSDCEEEYQDEDYGGDDDYYDDGNDGMDQENNNNDDDYEHQNQPQLLLKKQSSAATHKNVEMLQKNIIITRIEQSIDVVQEEQGISCGRALFLLRACGYNVLQTQNIPSNLMDDIYFSETKETTEKKNNQKCLSCDCELNENSFNLECMHIFCKGCVQKYITTQLSGDEDAKICCTCPLNGCKERFGYKDFLKLLPDQDFQEYKAFLENDAYKKADYILKCPKNCNIVIVQLDQMSLKAIPKNIRCQCQTMFCSACGNNAHEPMKCSIVIRLQELDKEYATLNLLKENESDYKNSDHRGGEFTSSFNRSSENNWCPNGCPKFLVPVDGEANQSKCPFCEGVFCKNCKELIPCKCMQEESKEEQQEKEVEEREKQNKKTLSQAISYLHPILSIFRQTKQDSINSAITKKKCDEFIKQILTKNPNRISEEFNFTKNSFEVLEDLILFLGNSNVYLKIGVSTKKDLLKFQIDELQKQFDLFKQLMFDELKVKLSLLINGKQQQETEFNHVKDQIIRLAGQLSKNQQNCYSDFSGVNTNEQEFNENYEVYKSESPNAFIKVKKEQERRNQANKGPQFDMMGGGGGYFDRMKQGYNKYSHQRPPQNRSNYNMHDDSDDDDDDNNGFFQYNNQQQLIKQKMMLDNILLQIKQSYPEIYNDCSTMNNYESVKRYLDNHKRQKLLEERKKQQIWISDNVKVILDQGVKLYNRVYIMKLDENSLKDYNNPQIQLLIENYQELLSAYEGKMKTIQSVCNWEASYFCHFEYLFSLAFEKITQKKDKHIGDYKCIGCKNELYSSTDIDYQTKILPQVLNSSDQDVIQLNGCLHYIHLGCLKQRILPDGTYKCPSCNTDYLRNIASSMKGEELKSMYGQYKYIQITYHIPDQIIDNKQILSRDVIAYLTPSDDQTLGIYEAYCKAFSRGLIFEAKLNEQGEISLQFRIYHIQKQPPRYISFIDDQQEIFYEIAQQLNSYGIPVNQK